MKSKLMDLLIFSEKRKNLLLLLRDGPKNLGEVKQSLSVTSSGIIPQIRMLEKRNLICQVDKDYYLTDMGRLLSNYLHPFVRIVDIIERNEDYWNTHDFTVIPEHLLRRIHELEDSYVDEVDLHSMYEPHRLFFESLSKSNWIKGVTPVFNPSYPEFILQLAKAGKTISIILAPEVYKRAEAEYEEFKNEFLTYDTAIYIYNGEIRLASIITDCYFSITPFFKGGGYDSQRNLVSISSSSIAWGEELFEYLLENSTEID